MPNASAPRAPWVLVWESPQTIVMPGWVSPCCGLITCTMPCPASPIGNSRMPNSAQFLRRVSTWTRETGSVTGLPGPTSGSPGPETPSVGTLWSSVATVRSGRRTPRPASRRPSNACGLVTSWIRWRSMYSRSGSPSARCTTCESQIFCASVRPMREPLSAGASSRSVQLGPLVLRVVLRRSSWGCSESHPSVIPRGPIPDLRLAFRDGNIGPWTTLAESACWTRQRPCSPPSSRGRPRSPSWSRSPAWPGRPRTGSRSPWNGTGCWPGTARAGSSWARGSPSWPRPRARTGCWPWPSRS